MNLTATSTAFLLLQDSVSHLWTAFESVVGGVGIVVAVVLVLVGYVTSRANKQELEELRKTLKTDILAEADEKALNLQAMIDASVDDLRKEIETQRRAIEGDVARSYARSSEKDKFWATAFNWWLTAAAHYSAVDSDDLFPIAVKAAKRTLEEIKAGDSLNINDLVERLTDNKESITEIAKKHPAEAALLEKKMSDIAALPIKSTTEPPRLSAPGG